MIVRRLIAILLFAALFSSSVAACGCRVKSAAKYGRFNARNNIWFSEIAVQTLAPRRIPYDQGPREWMAQTFLSVKRLQSWELSPAKGVGSPAVLRMSIDEILRRAENERNQLYYEDVTNSEQWRTALVHDAKGMLAAVEPRNYVAALTKAGLPIEARSALNKEAIHQTLDESQFILVRDPWDPDRPILMYYAWDFISVATWRWDAKKRQGSIFLSSEFARVLRQEDRRALAALALYEAVKIAAAKTNIPMDSDTLDHVAREIEEETSGLARPYNQTPVEYHMAVRFQKLLEAIFHPQQWAALYIVHASRHHPQIGEARRFISRLVGWSFTGIYDIAATIQDPPDTHAPIVHAGYRHTTQRLPHSEALRKHRLSVLTGGPLREDLSQMVNSIIYAVLEGRERGEWQIHLPLKAIFDLEQETEWSQELGRHFEGLFRAAGYHLIGRVGPDKHQWLWEQNGKEVRFVVSKDFDAMVRLFAGRPSFPTIQFRRSG